MINFKFIDSIDDIFSIDVISKREAYDKIKNDNDCDS
jgi:hypothetical protein